MRFLISLLALLFTSTAFAQIGPKPTPSDAILVVATGGANAQAADINQPSFYAVPTSGIYRVSSYIVVTQAATTSSTMPSVSASYTEPVSGQAVQDQLSLTASTNLLGLHSGGSIIIRAQQSSNIGYITSGYASSGATPMQYSISIKIEFLGS